MCNRHIDIHRFAGNSTFFLGGHHTQRTHIVQAISELHENDADIARHCQQHFAEILRLCLNLALEFNLF